MSDNDKQEGLGTNGQSVHHPYRRNPDLPWYVSDPDHPATQFRAIMFAFLFLPGLTIISWVKALEFDPVTAASVFGKSLAEIEPATGTELRIIGVVIAAIGLMLLFITFRGALKKRATLKESKMLIWLGLWLALLGAAPFEVAKRTEAMLMERGTFTPEQVRGGAIAQILRALGGAG